jgi:hypothetical protein
MPHALINCKTNVRAEADPWLPTLSASALSTQSGVNSSEDTQTHRDGRKPPSRSE